MHNYIHVPLPAPICVKSIVSVYHRELQHHFDPGEKLNFSELFYVESGSYNLSIDDKTFTLTPGEVIIFSPESYTRSACRNTATVSIISFFSESSALKPVYNRIITLSLKQREMLRETVNSSLDILVWSRIFDDYGFSIKEGTDELTVQEIKNKLELLLIDLCRTCNHPVNYNEKLFVKLSNYLKEHICEKLTLTEIADNLSISVSKLKSVCLSQCNTSPIEYFISLKLNEAKRMIEDSDLNVSQISDALGFSSIHYFSKLFKKKTGISPSQYAKLIKNQQ